MVGAVGSGVSLASGILARKLREDFGYTVRVLKASDIIRDNASKASLTAPAASGASRIMDLQKIGTALRRKFQEDYIAAKIIENIAAHRSANGGYENTHAAPQPTCLRQATIIDSLKHPKEADLLKKVYGGMYWQFTIFAPETVRERLLKNLSIEKDSIPGIFTRDENDREGDHGQKVSKISYLSDFFIRNDGQNDSKITASIDRFLSIIFNISVSTPTLDESGMHAAVSAASKSACLSRQVGAAIYSKAGELLSVGWNDVPKKGGGLYNTNDGDFDHRCFRWGDKRCHNDRKKQQLYDQVFERLSKGGLLREEVTKNQIESELKSTSVRDIIEYSRSIHAEMEAILSISRSGKSGIVGSTLYTTTFPYHNCARHIVAAGVKTVLYVEPYAKSLALELHDDSISLTEQNDDKSCTFLQYEGVGPNSILKLFHHGSERKNNGNAIVYDRRVARPILPPPLDGFSTHEKRVIEKISLSESRSESTPLVSRT